MNEWKPLILVVEDDKDMAQLCARLLERQGYDALIACSVSETKVCLSESSPDLYILDIGLPDGDGLSLCEEIRRTSDAPVMFCSGRSEISDKTTSLGIGGDYYITKPFDRAELIAAVKSLLRRDAYARNKIAEGFIMKKDPLMLDIEKRKAYVNGCDIDLTSKEFAVLLILMRYENREVAYETIYEYAWGMPFNDDVVALRQLILRLRKKTDEESTDSFSILNKHGKGYTFTTM